MNNKDRELNPYCLSMNVKCYQIF